MLLRQVRTVQTVQLVWILQVQFLGVVDMPVVVLDKCMIQTVQKTAEFAVLGGCPAVVATTGARFGPDSAENCGDSAAEH